jgi:hypothetical protein
MINDGNIKMETNLIERNSVKIAEIISDKVEINNVQDALDLMVNISCLKVRNIILYEKNLSSNFFELRTKLAGEILQKYVNYKMKLAIIGDFNKYNSNSLNAFIVECNQGKQIFFTADLESAIEKLLKSN